MIPSDPIAAFRDHLLRALALPTQRSGNAAGIFSGLKRVLDPRPPRARSETNSIGSFPMKSPLRSATKRP